MVWQEEQTDQHPDLFSLIHPRATACAKKIEKARVPLDGAGESLLLRCTQ